MFRAPFWAGKHWYELSEATIKDQTDQTIWLQMHFFNILQSHVKM